jgi:hypothetical protein
LKASSSLMTFVLTLKTEQMISSGISFCRRFSSA